MKTLCRIIFLLGTVVLLGPQMSYSQEQTTTSGNIGFTGFYELPETPQPQPPNGAVDAANEAPPGLDASTGFLPKLTDSTRTYVSIVGMMIVVSTCFVVFARKKNQRKEEHK